LSPPPHRFPKVRRPVSIGRLPKPDRCQTIELLAVSRDGCTDRGWAHDLIRRAGDGGRRAVELARAKISGAGRPAIARKL